MVLSPNSLIEGGGLVAIGLIIFAESGLMVGFFFPGDTLLISAGVFAASGKISLAGVMVVASIAAIAGDNAGYHIGHRVGRRLFRKKDGVVFREEYVDKSEDFFEKHGSKSMLLSHFLPIVRTFLPIVAGVAKMKHVKFTIFDAIGDVAWAVLVTLLGYYVGSKIPGLDRYILLLVLFAVLSSFAPILYRLATHKELRRKAKRALKKKFHSKKQRNDA
jgi:membrane-associated protein